jgi:hypothetical protein
MKGGVRSHDSDCWAPCPAEAFGYLFKKSWVKLEEEAKAATVSEKSQEHSRNRQWLSPTQICAGDNDNDQCGSMPQASTPPPRAATASIHCCLNFFWRVIVGATLWVQRSLFIRTVQAPEARRRLAASEGEITAPGVFLHPLRNRDHRFGNATIIFYSQARCISQTRPTMSLALASQIYHARQRQVPRGPCHYNTTKLHGTDVSA